MTTPVARQNIRVKHTIILDDPFDDPPDSTRSCQTRLPRSQNPNDTRLEDDWVPEEAGRDADAQERATRDKEARNRAVVLEMIGDLPDADRPRRSRSSCASSTRSPQTRTWRSSSAFGKVTSCDVIQL